MYYDLSNGVGLFENTVQYLYIFWLMLADCMYGFNASSGDTQHSFLLSLPIFRETHSHGLENKMTTGYTWIPTQLFQCVSKENKLASSSSNNL